MVTANNAHAPDGDLPLISLDLTRDKHFAFNSHDSMFSLIGISRDFATMGDGLQLFSERIKSGGHRNSIVAIAEGCSDDVAIDCQSWTLAQRFEFAEKDALVVGWAAKRKGLSFISSRSTPTDMIMKLY